MLFFCKVPSQDVHYVPLFSKDVTPSGFYNEVDFLELGQICENLNIVSVSLGPTGALIVMMIYYIYTRSLGALRAPTSR